MRDLRHWRGLGLVVALGVMALGVVLPAWQLARSGPVGEAGGGPARAVSTALLPGLGNAPRTGRVNQPGTPPAQLAAAQASFAKLPLHFEPNVGQMDAAVDFMSKGAGHTVYLTPAEAVIALHSKDNPTALQLRLRGANESAESFVTNKLPGQTSYFRGNQPEKWHKGIAQYARAGYHSVYPGIDLVYYGNESGRLEHDFIVAPGADPSQIGMDIDGAESLRLDRNGDLVLDTAAGEVRLQRPVVYQTGASGREPVAAKYRLRGRTVRFVLGDYDATRELVIDPVIVYSSFFGWTEAVYLHDVAVDPVGNIYLFGITDGAGPAGDYGAYADEYDYFVAKLDPAGASLIYLAYLGSQDFETNDPHPGGAVDATGSAYLAGTTSGTDYPTTPGAPQTVPGSATYHGVLSRLNPAGNDLIFSTYLGGDSESYLTDVAVNANQQAFVTGMTFATDFPGTTDGVARTYNGTATETVVAAIDPTPSGGLLWATYFGGDANDLGWTIALSNAGIYVAGETQSSDLPTSGAFQTIRKSLSSGYIAWFDYDGDLQRATYLGGDEPDIVRGLAIGPMGQVLAVGDTFADSDFTHGNAAQPTYGGQDDAFVANLSADLTTAPFVTYLGGNYVDRALGAAVDSKGTLWVAGLSGSEDFPAVNPIQPGHADSQGRSILARYTMAGDLLFSSYVGGDVVDFLMGVATTPLGQVIAVGATLSDTLPPADLGYQKTKGNLIAGWIVMLESVPPSLTSAATTSFTEGHPGSFTVTTSGDTPLTITQTGDALPAGLTFVDSGIGTATLSGTPTAHGTFSLVFQAANGTLPNATQAFTLTVNPPVAIAPATLPDWTVNQPGYSETLAATDGTGAKTLSHSQGTLPTGLTFDPDTGVLSGTPTATGNFTFEITAVDTLGALTRQYYVVTIHDALAITTTSLPDWTRDLAGYSQTLAATGGTGTLTWSKTAGDLPDGLALDSATGELSGTPTAAGQFTFTIQVQDGVGATADQEYTVTISDPAAITTASLPDWTKDLAGYSQTVGATGGTGALTLTLAGGTLPTGLSFAPDTGVIEGTPTVARSFDFTIQVTDAVGEVTKQDYTVTIHDVIAITTTALADWTKGLAGYSQTLAATGGTGDLQWTVSAGALPDGLALGAASGELAGTPTAAAPFGFTVTATDALGATGTRDYTVTIYDGLAVTTATLPDGVAHQPGYSQTLSSVGGTGTVTWTVSAGALPAGLTLTGNTAEIRGEPTTVGTATFTVRATDETGATAERELTLTVTANVANTGQSSATVPDGTAGAPTTITVAARDALGNLRAAGGDTVVVAITGANSATPTVTDHGDGTYTATYTPTVAGTDSVAITLNGDALVASPYTSRVAPGAMAAAQSSAEVPDGEVGSPTTITVTARDAQGNVRTAGGDTVVVTITGANSATPTVTDHGDGTYTAAYMPTDAGTDSVAITINGVALAASPYPSRVAPVGTAAEQSTATVPDGTAGLPTTITVTARDTQGNLRAAGGDIVVVTITGANSATATVTDNDNGTYTATYTPTVAGTDSVAITTNGDALAASPYTSQVAAGAISGEQSQVTVDRDHLLADGQEAVTLTITLRDAQGNPIAGVAPEDLAAVADPANGVTFGPWSGATDAAGQATVTATRTVAGELNFTITASAQQLVDAPHVAFRPVLTVTFPAGLHLLGLPGTPDDPRPASVLGEPVAGWKQARWDPATQAFVYFDQQPDADLLRFGPGRGQWVRFAADTTLTLAGEATPDGPFTLPVPEGWSNGANPFGAALPWTLDDIQVRLGGADVGSLSDPALWDKVRPYLWIYDAVNQTNRLIFPGLGDETVPAQAGFWAKALVGDAELILAPPAAGRSRARAASTARDWLATLIAAGADGLATSVTVGTSSRLAQPLAVERPPVNGAAPAVEVSVIATNGSRLAGELQPAAGTFAWDLAVTSRQAGDVNLRWPSLLRDLPAGLILELADQQTGQTMLLNTRAAYRFAATRADETRRLRLTARIGHIDRATITNLSAQPNRAGGTTLQLTLSAPAEVQLTVRGLGGRLVREISQPASEGTVALTWDGLDADGRRVPRGTYQVEATAVSANGAVHRAVRVVAVP